MAVSIPRAAVRDLLLLCGGAVLYIAAFFPAVWGSTAWLAVCPFYLALGDKTPARGFWAGAVYGLLMSAGLAGWASAMPSATGAAPFSSELIGTLARLGLFFGVSYGLVAALSCLLLRSDRPLLRWIGMPAVWVSGELVRTSLQAGFHWDLLGYTQYQILPLIQIADVTGVYGLSFLLALSGYVVAECVMSLPLSRPLLPQIYATKRFSLPALNGLGFGILLTLLYGMTCLSHYPTLTLALPSIPVPLSPLLPESSQPLIEVSLRHHTRANRVYATQAIDPLDLSGQRYREQLDRTPFAHGLLSSEVQQPYMHTPPQHPCAAPSFLPITFQAIETRQPFWPQDAAGQLGFIDPAGRCYVLSREEARMVLRHTSLESVSTVYTEYGDWFAFACSGFGLMALVRGRKPRLSTQNVSSPDTHHAAAAVG